MTTEFRNPSSRCRGCSCRNTRRRVLHHRNHHQRRSRRCLSIVTTPEVRNPCSPCPRRSRSIRLPRRRRRKGCRRHSRTCSCIVPACRSAGGGTEGLHERWPRACSDPPSHALRVGRAKISTTAAPQLSYRQKNCFSVSENIFQVLLKSQFVSQLPRFITEQATLPICGPPERLRFPCTRPEVRCKHRRQRRGSFGPLSYRALLSYVQCIRTVYMYRSWFRFRYRCFVSESVLGSQGFKAQMRGGYVGLRVGWLVVSFGHGAYCVCTCYSYRMDGGMAGTTRPGDGSPRNLYPHRAVRRTGRPTDRLPI